MEFAAPPPPDLAVVSAGRVVHLVLRSTAHPHLGPRFEIAIVDAVSSSNSSTNASAASSTCSVLLIPAGRELEYSFSHDEGRLALAAQAGFARMIFVALGRGHVHGDFAAIQVELNVHMRALAPKAARAASIPYLTASGDKDLGQRTEVHRGSSAFSGALIICQI